MSDPPHDPLVEKALKALARLPAETLEAIEKVYPKAETEAIRELAFATDRAAAIVGAAMIDDALTGAIKRRFRPLSKTASEGLVGESGPINSLSRKIELGYALGLYGKITCRDLHLIRKIRNKFAHKAEVRSFDDEDISKLVALLRLIERVPAFLSGEIPNTGRERFIYSALVLYEEIKDAPENRPPPPPAHLP